jgi:hypothetical protein
MVVFHQMKLLESAAQIIIDLFTLLINNKNMNETNQLETKSRFN